MNEALIYLPTSNFYRRATRSFSEGSEAEALMRNREIASQLESFTNIHYLIN